MIFVDSSYFIGLALESDQWHERAVELIPKLDERNKMVSGFIISETVTMVGSRSGGKAGKMLYDYIIDNCNVFNQEKTIFADAIQTYLKYDGTLSFTDSITLEIMRIFQIQEILSFDSDFDKIEDILRIY